MILQVIYLVIIYFTLYFREHLSKMEYFVLIIIYFTLYFREDSSKMEYFVLIMSPLRTKGDILF
jgi:hypothetical protein